MKITFNADHLSCHSPRLAGQSAMAVINSIQSLPPETQLAGVATAFVSLCRKYRQHPGNIMTVAGNLLDEAKAKHPELLGLTKYVQHEL